MMKKNAKDLLNIYDRQGVVCTVPRFYFDRTKVRRRRETIC